MSENNQSYTLFSFGISSDEAMKQVMNHSKLIVEKDKTSTVNVGNKEFVVTYHVASKLRSFYRNNVECDCCKYQYAPEQAVADIYLLKKPTKSMKNCMGTSFIIRMHLCLANRSWMTTNWIN